MKFTFFQRRCATLVALALLAGISTAQTTSKPTDGATALAAAAAEKGAVVSPTGLVYLSMKEGSGHQPLASDTVSVHYRGSFTDGREFDSSHKRGQAANFPLNRVIPCWTEGLQKMKVGGKAKLTCPAAIAYGERGAGGGLIPPHTVLQFEVELLGVDRR